MEDYTTLGRSGLRVSPLCMGAATIEAGELGTDEKSFRQIFDRYIEVGGNFFDTANFYANGKSESALGKFIEESGIRDKLIIGTKFSINSDADNPNAGGNGRKNIYYSLEHSLRRLKTDYIDLYWVNIWDTITPIDEVVSTLDNLIKEGKILHYGFSNVPAWYLTKAYSFAVNEGKEKPISLQLEYSLLERNIENEHIPASQDLGLAVCSWSPLAGGFLSGKYKKHGNEFIGEGRLGFFKKMNSPFLTAFNDRHWNILHELVQISQEVGRTPAEVAINWAINQPGITCVNIGAVNLKQLNENLSAPQFVLPEELHKRLTKVSALDPVYPYKLFSTLQSVINGNKMVHYWMPD